MSHPKGSCTVDGHFVLEFPDRFRQIVRGRQEIAPNLFVIQKRKIFTVVVLVAIINIKTHTAKDLVHLLRVGANILRHVEQVPVVEIGLAVRRFQQRSER